MRLADDPQVALARYVRWSLQGPATGTWKACFRVFASADVGASKVRAASRATRPAFRLTATSGTPVTTVDATGATLYFTPFRHAQLVLFDGTTWTGFTSGELSLAGPLTASSVYDVFAYYDPATNAVKLEQSFAWSNDTTRVDAVVR